ncbi:MAG: spore coat protein U domain-containing protein [Deltaproteobacteria bacterium]|nr:spore coat protein U domain-containing protein [Deltaproteobacteria bacterium]
MKRLLAILFAAASLAFSAGVASAATSSAGLMVQVTAVAACDMTTNPVNFPTYASYQAGDNTAQGGINVACPNGVYYSLSMDGGYNFSTNPRMSNGLSSYLNYGLYSDAGYYTPMTSTYFANNIAGTGSNQNYPVYGKLFAGQYADTTYPNYWDYVTVTIT